MNDQSNDPSVLRSPAPGPALQGLQIDDEQLDTALSKAFKPTSAQALLRVEQAVQTLAQEALKRSPPTASEAVALIEMLIVRIDEELSAQINLILHAPEFQRLEASWRGLEHLVRHTETDEQLKIRVMPVGKQELSRSLRRFQGTAWDQSPLFKKVYEEEYGQFGGEPYGALVADYSFDHSPPDVELLTQLSQVAAAAHAPLITNAAPALMQMQSWAELANPRDLSKIFTTPEYAGWRALRESEDARYVALCMPRFLGRLPYGAATSPVEEFAFEEDVGSHGEQGYVWCHSAYAMGTNITRAFKLYGWCSRIRGVESGGAVEHLPTHVFPTDDGGMDTTCPTEIAISDRREAELARNGLLALVHRKNTDVAAFIGGQSLHKPAEYDDPDATANAALAARLPYLFACCRFAHYLKCLVRDKIGSFRSRDDMQRWLNDWVLTYVDGDPANSSEQTKAERPLAAAEVVVEDVEGAPGYYQAKFFLKPHYQLEGLTVSLRLVSRLPSEKT
ncbi:type VI secretion system protein ImpC [Roseateles sp. YR242]|uniref:type VI secretion system contractile sheath large subunit n=1 Tax=Roseateles sp. YR242 TaxID=1855305 RepID=UPI0008B4029D|nr:type VI secretion system contractile sheath large subunit [Roseateles sp. YR242]SEK22330.1 type VI secretion system protein ImpC [Roseateles sp. YR242]